MSRQPDWTSAEFETLLSMPRATDAEVAKALHTRSEGAVASVREAIHDHHGEVNFDGLSAMMQRRIEDKTRGGVCARCGQSL